jgi:hypothetical protein
VVWPLIGDVDIMSNNVAVNVQDHERYVPDASTHSAAAEDKLPLSCQYTLHQSADRRLMRVLVLSEPRHLGRLSYNGSTHRRSWRQWHFLLADRDQPSRCASQPDEVQRCVGIRHHVH